MNNKEIFNYCKKVIREHSDMKVFNDEKGIYERRTDDYIVYIQDSNDVDINQDGQIIQ